MDVGGSVFWKIMLNYGFGLIDDEAYMCMQTVTGGVRLVISSVVTGHRLVFVF